MASTGEGNFHHYLFSSPMVGKLFILNRISEYFYGLHAYKYLVPPPKNATILAVLGEGGREGG